MLLVFLAKGDTFEQLGCHFGIGTETARRHVNEGIDTLAALAPNLADALASSGEERRLLRDGALMSAWRRTSPATEANPDPLCQAKRREHGMNVQALATTQGELVFLGVARAGSTHDLTAAHADGAVHTPIERPQGSRNGWEKPATIALARLRAPAERPFRSAHRTPLVIAGDPVSRLSHCCQPR
ncbi:hypothetical protein AB0C96_33755 [Streptomyces sp. NPDC048506]|uniref:hypothetical protein n=1 Tax=Streptomyces sp. NPDC048506 TaxID=3155028 RepID=UPI003428CBF2